MFERSSGLRRAAGIRRRIKLACERDGSGSGNGVVLE